MGFITDAEFLLLYEERSQIIWTFLTKSIRNFLCRDQNGAECSANLRVEKLHTSRLEDALQIPAIFKCDQGTVCDGTEGLCILLKRFAYPCRYSDMIPILHGLRSQSRLDPNVIYNRDRQLKIKSVNV